MTITTTFGAEGKQAIVTVENGVVSPSTYCVHFPVPMVEAWDNVIYTCSTMLLFESEEEVDGWCARHRERKGDVQPLQKVFEFAKIWYGSHLDPCWRKWTLEEARNLFEACGFTHPTWNVSPQQSKF